MIAAATRALGEALGRPVRIERRTPLGGGSISHVERLATDAGSFVLKWNDEAPDGLFEAEADGLDALRESKTPLAIPRVVVRAPEAGPDRAAAFIILEDLGTDPPSPTFDEDFGRGLAALHRHRGDRFGFARDNFCGATPQLNRWHDSWVGFYAAERLGYQAELAARRGLLDADERRAIERVIAGLPRWLAEPDAPSLVHGDLWSGNLLAAAGGRPALLDPAVYFAHREVELGMMTLFGGFSRRMFDAYDEAFTLEPGWRDRNGLYQLYHLLNHLNLFDAGYLAGVMQVVRRYA